MKIRAICGSFLFSFFVLPSLALAAEPNQQALKDLESFLFNAAERQAYSKNDPKASAANNYLESFPSWAQQEMLEIVMMVMREEGEGAARYGSMAAASGAASAGQKFSPAVRSRMDALVKRLMADKNFNSSSNLEKMKTKMPMK